MSTSMNVDPRIALALSGDFCAPTDQIEDRRHNLGFLLMATLEKGDFDSDSLTSTYLPDWAPIMSQAKTNYFRDAIMEFSICKLDDPDTSITFSDMRYSSHWAGGTKTMTRTLAGVTRPIQLATQLHRLDTVEGCADARRDIALEATTFFSEMSGWTRGEDGLWVPPSPGAQEQADAS